MCEKLIEQISLVRDLGTKSQIEVEDTLTHQFGINLKRDAAGLALDYFFKKKDRTNYKLLHDSLSKYWEFAIFFIGLQLAKSSASLENKIKPYKKYQKLVEKLSPVFSSIMKAYEETGDVLVKLKTLEKKKLTTTDFEKTTKDIEELNEIDEFVERIKSCKSLFSDNQSDIGSFGRKARWVSFKNFLYQLFTKFLLPILIILIGGYLLFTFGWRR